MEHCVFAATLSKGKDHRDCGRPCERHRVELRDRVDQEHPLVADVGCRNTVYNAQAQSAAEYVPRMRELGLRHFRVELLREDAAGTRLALDHYARLIAGIEGPRAARRSLNVLSQLGVTAGTLDR
jgi:putative protease